MTFGFATQENPFTITYALCGGGGYVGLSLGFGGVVSVQAQFEVTGQVALDLYIVSAEVAIDLGIYILYQPEAANGFPEGLSLYGFVQLTGSVGLLGIVTITISERLELGFDPETLDVTGSASLSFGISVFCFSKTFTVTITKTFPAGNLGSILPFDEHASDDSRSVTSNSAPTALNASFGDLMTEQDWDQYCLAYSYNHS
jgi:hypothetical protein